MSFVFFAKSRQKGLPKRLRKALLKYQTNNSKDLQKEILDTLNILNECIIQQKYKEDHIPQILTQKIYRDKTVSLLILLMPSFEQATLNAIATLLQATMREFLSESLPQYLLARPTIIDSLVSYFDLKSISNTAHILFRACLQDRGFTQYIFQDGTAGSFLRFIVEDNFELAKNALMTYDSLLNTHPDIAAEYFGNDWPTRSYIFKFLIAIPKQIIQLSFLPILFKFLTEQSCRHVFLMFLDDVENLRLVMDVLRAPHHRLQLHGYNIFKMFVLNPQKSNQIKDALRPNAARLTHLLTELRLDDADPVLEREKLDVITAIGRL